MAGGRTPFDVRLWLYLGASPSSAPDYWGNETDISTYIRRPGQDGGQAITYSGGRQDEASQVDAGSMNLTLDNRDGRFSPKNAAGEYFGRLRRNTPCRLGVVSGYDNFGRSATDQWGTADSGNSWNVSGTAGEWQVDGAKGTINISSGNAARVAVLAQATALDVDVTMTAIPVVTATGASYGLGPIVRRTDSSNQVYATIEFNTAGTITTKIRSAVAGVTTELGSINPVPSLTYSAGDRWRIRVQADGATIRSKIWLESGSEPDTWHLSVTESANTGATVGVYLARFSGNTNATTQMAVDDYEAVGFEFTGTIPSWAVTWDKSASNSWVPITAAGVIRRLSQGRGTLKSPLTRQLGAYSPTGWWTLEDDDGATVFGSSVSGIGPAGFSGVDPGSDTTLAGAARAASLTATNGYIRGFTSRKYATGITGFSAMFLVKFGSGLPVTKTAVATWYSTGRGVRWVFSVDATVSYLDVYDDNGTSLSTSSAFHDLNTTDWAAWQLETEVVGANTEWALISHRVGQVSYFSQTGTVAGGIVASRITGFLLGGSNLATGTAFSHVWVGPNTLPFVTDTFSLVSSGYAGETASERIERLCTEQGIPIVIEPGDSDPCGVQPITNIMTALRSAEAADMGILYERGAGLGYRPRSVRYAQSVLMPLTVAAGQIDEPPTGIDDDQRFRNQWTVNREGGSYAVAYDQDSIDAEGLWEDSATLNVQDDVVLGNHAGWRLYLSTYPALRWPGLSLDLARGGATVQQLWRSRVYGFRMTVTTGLSQVTAADPDVIAEGFTATLWPEGWKVSLNCSSAKPWDIVALDAGLRLDNEDCILGLAVNSTAISLSLVTGGDGKRWVDSATYPAEFPFTITCGGEEMSVTAITGTTSSQTATVVRSTNGVVKSHSTGDPVSLASPMYLAL